MNPQYSIFISHASVDEEIADALKTLICESFPAESVFLSSDPEDLAPGDPWVEKVLSALRTAPLVLILATERGLNRKWVWFEAGRTWFAGVQLIPCCVGRVRKSQLPAPFSGLQGLNLDDERDVEALIGELKKGFGDPSGSLTPSAFARDIARLDVRAEEKARIISDPFTEERRSCITKQMKNFSPAERETIRQFVMNGELTTAAARAAVRETGVDMEKWSVPWALTNRVSWILAREGNRMDDPFEGNRFYINPDYRELLIEYFRER